MELVDTHCHLTELDEESLACIFSNASKCSVTRFLVIGATNGAKASFQAVALAEKYPQIWATVGIHPHDAGEFCDLSSVESLVSHQKVCAIGETGLDFYRDWAPIEKQILLFRSSIKLALKYSLPLIIHCRNAQEETLQILKEENAKQVGGVFHCYAGDAPMAEKLLELNFLVSFTGNITFKKANQIREVVKEVPLETIMLETDTPYMAPEPFRGSPSEPMHVYKIAEKIAEIKNISLEQVAEVTTRNAVKLFGLGAV